MKKSTRLGVIPQVRVTVKEKKRPFEPQHCITVNVTCTHFLAFSHRSVQKASTLIMAIIVFYFRAYIKFLIFFAIVVAYPAVLCTRLRVLVISVQV